LLTIPKSDIAVATTSHRDIGSIPHIFSHINMTYHIQHLVIESTDPPPNTTDPRAVWLDDEGVEHANVGTGVKKVWAEVFGAWGKFEAGAKGASIAKKAKGKVAKPKAEVVKNGDKVVKKIMMPSMPNRK
jgi:A/G-specific adenine glycosylase